MGIDVEQIDWDEAIGEPVTINNTLTVSGSVSVDEYIYHNGDADTFIKLTDNGILLKAGGMSMFKTSGSVGQILVNNGGHDLDFIVRDAASGSLLHTDAANARVGIGTSTPDYELHVAGDIGIDQYIRHNGDTNTHINFTDDKIVLKAGNKAMITMEEKGTAPHEVTINDGSNNIDFVVKGNGSNAGNPGMKFVASNNRVGINGVGTPATELHINGALTLNEKSSDPSNPSEGQSVLWMSDGTGTGDDGDILIKITAGGVTKTVTLVDFSAS